MCPVHQLGQMSAFQLVERLAGVERRRLGQLPTVPEGIALVSVWQCRHSAAYVIKMDSLVKLAFPVYELTWFSGRLLLFFSLPRLVFVWWTMWRRRTSTRPWDWWRCPRTRYKLTSPAPQGRCSHQKLNNDMKSTTAPHISSDRMWSSLRVSCVPVTGAARPAGSCKTSQGFKELCSHGRMFNMFKPFTINWSGSSTRKLPRGFLYRWDEPRFSWSR